MKPRAGVVKPEGALKELARSWNMEARRSRARIPALAERCRSLQWEYLTEYERVMLRERLERGYYLNEFPFLIWHETWFGTLIRRTRIPYHWFPYSWIGYWKEGKK
jgi:hypothetical protein